MIYVILALAFLGLAIASWYVLNALRTRRMAGHLRADDSGITVGPNDTIAWESLTEVRIDTTAAGPWRDDFFVILSAKGRRPVRIPEPLIGEDLLSGLQRLPGFDSEKLIGRPPLQ